MARNQFKRQGKPSENYSNLTKINPVISVVYKMVKHTLKMFNVRLLRSLCITSLSGKRMKNDKKAAILDQKGSEYSLA